MGQHAAAEAAPMTGTDLIVMAPWIIFGAALSAVYIRLRRGSHQRATKRSASLT